MSGLEVRQDDCALDFLSLGALGHRLDPGTTPFRRARAFDIHVSGGEYNVAANLADCFGLTTGVATAMVNNGIGELGQGRVREMGVKPFYKHFEHDDLPVATPHRKCDNIYGLDPTQKYTEQIYLSTF